jgi:hypothetical protein
VTVGIFYVVLTVIPVNIIGMLFKLGHGKEKNHRHLCDDILKLMKEASNAGVPTGVQAWLHGALRAANRFAAPEALRDEAVELSKPAKCVGADGEPTADDPTILSKIPRFLGASVRDESEFQILTTNSAANSDEQMPASLQHVGLGGEVLLLPLARLFLQQCVGETQLWNIYGPTECVVDATVIEMVPKMVLEDGCVAPKGFIVIGGGRQGSSSTLRTSNQLTKVDTHLLHYTLFIRMPNGTVTLLVEAMVSIAAIKTQLANRLCIPIHAQRLLWEGKQLHDRDSMEECGVGNNSTMQLMLRICGGMDGGRSQLHTQLLDLAQLNWSDWAENAHSVAATLELHPLGDHGEEKIEWVALRNQIENDKLKGSGHAGHKKGTTPASAWPGNVLFAGTGMTREVSAPQYPQTQIAGLDGVDQVLKGIALFHKLLPNEAGLDSNTRLANVLTDAYRVQRAKVRTTTPPIRPYRFYRDERLHSELAWVHWEQLWQRGYADRRDHVENWNSEDVITALDAGTEVPTEAGRQTESCINAAYGCLRTFDRGPKGRINFNSHKCKCLFKPMVGVPVEADVDDDSNAEPGADAEGVPGADVDDAEDESDASNMEVGAAWLKRDA